MENDTGVNKKDIEKIIKKLSSAKRPSPALLYFCILFAALLAMMVEINMYTNSFFDSAIKFCFSFSVISLFFVFFYSYLNKVAIMSGLYVVNQWIDCLSRNDWNHPFPWHLHQLILIHPVFRVITGLYLCKAGSNDDGLAIIEKAASQPIFQGAREARESTSSLKTLQYYTLLAILILLLTILGLFLGRNIREVHGSAINLATNEPYQNLQVELKELVSGKSISETTTDYSGEYIFKTKPGAYIATLSREGDNWSQTIIVPEITKIGVYNPGQEILVNNEDKYLSQASWIFNLVRRFLAQITPGFWLAGSVLSLLNMVILTTILNIVIFSFYITVGIMAFLFNKLRN